MTFQAGSGGKPRIGLSDLSVTEFVCLARMGFYPRGLVVGVSVFDAGWGNGLMGMTGEVAKAGQAMAFARRHAVQRMREQASAVGGEGVVGVRLEAEHHVWRGGHHVTRIVAIGTAIAFDPERAPAEFRGAPSLRMRGHPFTSDLSGQDFVTLLRAGYRPVTVALGSCTYEISTATLQSYATGFQNAEIPEYSQAFMSAREGAMAYLLRDLQHEHHAGHIDAPVGVVGMRVTESGRQGWSNVVECNAVGTAVALLEPNDPRRAATLPAPSVVVPLDV